MDTTSVTTIIQIDSKKNKTEEDNENYIPTSFEDVKDLDYIAD